MTILLIWFITLYLTTAVILLWLVSFSSKLTSRDYKDAILWLPIMIKLLKKMKYPKNIILTKLETLKNAENPQEEKYPNGTEKKG